MATLACLTMLFAATNKVPPGYYDAIRGWQQHRETGLRNPNSWLTLAGLFWLQPGKQSTIGSDETNDFVLPKSAPAHVGKLQLDGEKVVFTSSDGSSETMSLNEQKPDVIHAGTVSFYAIKRGDRIGIRAKDSASPVLKTFTGLKFFPVNPDLHFQATLIAQPKKIPILNVLGETDQEESPGIVEFAYRSKTYHLRPLYEGDTLFFLFKDETNKTETYQAGRMLNTPLPSNGKVDLDFNKAYNPPCTFTRYATCPLPPKENTLTFAVNAGEMRYGHGHPDKASAGK